MLVEITAPLYLNLIWYRLHSQLQRHCRLDWCQALLLLGGLWGFGRVMPTQRAMLPQRLCEQQSMLTRQPETYEERENAAWLKGNQAVMRRGSLKLCCINQGCIRKGRLQPC